MTDDVMMDYVTRSDIIAKIGKIFHEKGINHETTKVAPDLFYVFK